MNNETAKNQLVVVLKDARKDLSQLLNKLQLAQYIILVVQNRQDYISAIAATKPSAIILDLLLLDADGWNIAREIRQHPQTSSIPLVLLNSSSESVARVARLEWQNVSCMSEASDPDQIVDLITTHLPQWNRDLAISDRYEQDKPVPPKENKDSKSPINRGLEDLVSVVSQDLQAPLQSLAMFSKLLTSEYERDLDSKAKQYLEQIGNSSSKMQTLVEDLLSYSRAGKSEQTWIVIDLNQAIKQVIQNLDSAISAAGVQIAVGELPQVLVNPTEIDLLLHNLLENAIKFCAGQNPQIEVKATMQEGEWLISVADNGIGIAPEFKAQIFAPFKRLNSTKDYPGTGMGLAICQKIVKRYGGRLGVKSVVDRGSTFYFTLPVDVCLQPQITRSPLV